ncbi:MAG: SH3 domain-containing protein [Deltaproteobacteria bacterium]|nr:SH3 domain-containing protein [Candidatus Zymogenaceae bacterium]
MKTKENLRILSALFIPIVVTLFSTFPAIAAETAGYEVVPCEVHAYVIDVNPSGVNVRSGPGEGYPVIALLPPVGVAPDYNDVDVMIRGSVGEWMRISDPWSSTTETKEGFEKTVGWVYGPSLGLRAKGFAPLYEEPNTESPVLVRVPHDDGGAVIGCQGEWVKVNYRGVKGWLAPGTHCGASVTTCP